MPPIPPKPSFQAVFSRARSSVTIRQKRGVAIALLAAAIPTASILPSLAEETAVPLVEFSDTQGHWAAACIERMGSGNYMKGYANRRFLPNNTMTRAEYAAVMVKIYVNAPKIRSAPQFGDVPANFWARDAINKAYERGLLTGYSNSQFRPLEPVSRAQAMTVLAKAEALEEVADAEAILSRYYTDHTQIPSYARGPIAAATTAGKRLVVNYPTVEQFRANDSIQRGEVAASLCQATRDGSDYRYNVPDQYIVTLVNRWRDRLVTNNPNQSTVGPITFDTVFFDADGFGLKMGEADEVGNPQWGIVNRSGQWVIEPRFVSLNNFSEGLAVGHVEQNSQQYEVLDQQGRTVFTADYFLQDFSEGLAAFQNERGAWGFIDPTGKVVIPAQFFEVAPFSDGLARVSKAGEQGLGTDQYGFINKVGEVVIPLQYSSIQETFEDGLIGVQDDSGQWGYLNTAGEWAIAPQFTVIRPFSDGLAGATTEGDTNQRWGFIDRTGAFAIAPQYFAPPPVYEEAIGMAVGPPAIDIFSEGFAVVRLGEEVGLIDRNGQWRINPTDFDNQIDHIGTVQNGIAEIMLNGDTGYIQVNP